MRKLLTLGLISLLLFSLATALSAPVAADRDINDIDESYFMWGPLYEISDGTVSDPTVLVTDDQEMVVLWEDSAIEFALMSKDGMVHAYGTVVDLPDDWAAALAGDGFVVVWTESHRVKLQRFDLGGEPVGAERTVTVDSSGIGSPAVGVSEDGNIYISYISNKVVSPRVAFLALDGDGSKLISTRLVDVDGKDATATRVETGDGNSPYLLVSTTSGTYLVSMSRTGSVEWHSALYAIGTGRSPDMTVRDGVVLITWADNEDLDWVLHNDQGSTIAASGHNVPGMDGAVRSGIDSNGLVQAVVNVGPSLRHLVLGTGGQLLVEQNAINDAGMDVGFDLVVDRFDALYMVHAGPSLYYTHAKTYSFELVGSDLTDLATIHPSEKAVGSFILANRGGLMDAIGFDANVYPAGSGWYADVSTDEIYLSSNGENSAFVTVFGPEDGQDGDTATLSLSLSALSMPSKSIEMDVPLTLSVDYGLVIEADENFKTLSPGHSKDYTVTLTNDGEVEEDVLLLADIRSNEAENGRDRDDSRKGEWRVMLSTSHVTIGAGEDADVTLTVSAPEWAPEGQLAVVDLTGMVQDDPDTSTKLNLYALAMSEVQISMEATHKGEKKTWSVVAPGKDTEFQITVRNDGLTDSTVNVLLEVVSGIGDWQAYLATNTIKLQGGTSIIVPLTIVAPEDALEGQRFVVRVRAMDDRKISEAHVDITTFVSQVSDISVKLHKRYAYADPGKEAEYSFDVTNDGNGVEAALLFSDTPFGWAPVKFFIDDSPVGGVVIGVGETVTVDARVSIPPGTTAGDYKLKLRVVDGENEEMDIVAHVNTVSDIWISAAETVREAVDGKASFNFRIKNYGNGPDEVQLLPEGLPDGLDVEFPDAPGGFMQLSQGKERLISMDVTVPENIHDEDYEFGLRALPKRGDGVLVKLLIKVVTPDLEITGVDFSTNTFIHGDVEAVTVTVRNNGPGIAGRVVVMAEDNGRTFGTTEVYRIRARAEATVTFTWAVQEGTHNLRFTVDPDNRIFEKDEDNNQEEVKVTATGRTTPTATADVGTVAAATFTVTLVLVVGAAASSEAGRFKLIWFFWVPLYTKLKRTGVLDHFVRGQVFGYIKANPGEHYNAIKKALDMKNGTLVYHLQTLEREEYIKSVSDGRYKRFYPAGMKIPDEPSRRLNRIQEIILKLIGENPGISQKEIAEEIGLSSATINYHVNVMIKGDFIRKEKVGRTTHCYVIEEEVAEET
jgi:uncharacterized membrane protein/DNA-binding MarR family transcriptional regulator